MSQPEPSNYFEYIICDADSYGAVLSEANLEISQLEPERLSGRHVRLGLPGGQFSYVETSAQLRGNGTFPNLWTLSVILGSTTRSRQHGIEVRAGSLVIHRPGVEHDGIYGRNFKVACFTVHDDVLAKLFPQLHPQLQDAMRRPWSVFEPPANSRQKIIEHFAEGGGDRSVLTGKSATLAARWQSSRRSWCAISWRPSSYSSRRTQLERSSGPLRWCGRLISMCTNLA